MNEYVFADLADTLQLYSHPTVAIGRKNTARDIGAFKLTSPLNSNSSLAAMDQEFWVQNNFITNTTFPENLDLSYLDTCNNNSQVVRTLDEASKTIQHNLSTNDQGTLFAPCNADLQKLGQQILAPSYELLQKLREKKLNLILVATSLDEDYVLQKLKGALDTKTSRMIPLSMKNDDKKNNVNVSSKTVHDIMPEEVGEESSSIDDSSQIDKRDGARTANLNVKRKQKQGGKDEKYWKRRSSNNDAARRSREAKRTRFVWIEARSKQLELENAKLEEQLKTLQSKISKLENLSK